MTRLLEIKALLTGIYKQYDKIINPIGKFIISLIIVIKLNSFFGNSPIFAKLGVNIVLAAMAAVLPGSWFLLLLMVVVGVQLFAVSFEAAVIVFIVMLIAYFLFSRLQPKYAFLTILVPLFYSMKLLYILPLFVGLFMAPGAAIALAIGVGVYRFAGYLPGLLEIKVEGGTLLEMPDVLMNMYKYLMNVLTHDKELVLVIAIFTLVVFVMYFVRQLEMDYIWYISTGVGVLTMIIGFVVGNIVLKTQLSILGMIIGTIFGGCVVAGMQFFKFSLDYKRGEKLQFEDDDYYYYVRTIPKVKVTKAQKEVRTIK